MNTSICRPASAGEPGVIPNHPVLDCLLSPAPTGEPDMRLQPATINPRVTRNANARRSILLTIAGHAYALSPNEARDLADQLHDAAETSTL